MLLAEAVRMHAAQHPEKIAIFEDTRQISYGELYHGIKLAAHELLACEDKFGKGSMPLVGLLMTNSSAMIQYFLAATKIGLCAVV